MAPDLAFEQCVVKDSIAWQGSEFAAEIKLNTTKHNLYILQALGLSAMSFVRLSRIVLTKLLYVYCIAFVCITPNSQGVSVDISMLE